MEPTYHKKDNKPRLVIGGTLEYDRANGLTFTLVWIIDFFPSSSRFLPQSSPFKKNYIVSCGDEGWEAMWWSRVVQNPRYCSLSLKIDGRERGHPSQVIITNFSSKTIKSYKKPITNRHPWKHNIIQNSRSCPRADRLQLITNSSGWIR